MPTLDQFVEQQVLSQAEDRGVLVEPLDGPTNVDAVMDRFPETIYQQGRDSHLYRFLTAVCGDAGAAMLKKQAFIARLRSEAEIINFSDLDAFYTSHFRFNRLSDETYAANAVTDSLTPDEWDDLQKKDQSYRSRMIDFFNSTRLGNTAEGMRLASRSGSGVDSEIVEHYRYIFDLYSDDPLNLTPYGQSISTAEGVVVPRVIDNSGVGDPSRTFTTTRTRVANFTKPVLATGARPVPAPVGPNVFAVNYTWDTSSRSKLSAAFERNMIEVLDRLAPLGTFATVVEERVRFVPYNGLFAFASSERIHVSRFVEGRGDVNWPDLDKTGNFFIQSGVEKESGYAWGGARSLPIIFHSLESLHAYTEGALSDTTYNSDDFYSNPNGTPAYFVFRSEHIGPFLAKLNSIYPFLQNVPSFETFSADKAAAIHDTPLVLEAGAA